MKPSKQDLRYYLKLNLMALEGSVQAEHAIAAMQRAYPGINDLAEAQMAEL